MHWRGETVRGRLNLWRGVRFTRASTKQSITLLPPQVRFTSHQSLHHLPSCTLHWLHNRFRRSFHWFSVWFLSLLLKQACKRYIRNEGKMSAKPNLEPSLKWECRAWVLVSTAPWAPSRQTLLLITFTVLTTRIHTPHSIHYLHSPSIDINDRIVENLLFMTQYWSKMKLVFDSELYRSIWGNIRLR